MIILINGASCTGKTYLSQMILERFSFTYYSIDHIKMGLYRGDPNCIFSPTDDNDKISKSLAPIIEGIIRTSLENKQNLTIEGCYFESESIKRLQNDYPNELISISIVFSDDYCKNHFQRSIQKYRSIIENRQYGEDRTLEQFIEENKKVLSFSQKNGFHVFEVDQEYGSTIEAAMNYIDARLLCSTSHNSE
jgi:putative acetyltransferase